MYLYLVMLTIASTAGLQAWTTLFNNFAVEVAGLDGDGIGIIPSIREIPGLLALLAIFVIRFMPEHRLSALSILLLGLGIAATGLWGFSRKPNRVDIAPQHKRMIFRKRYWLYYFLTFMAGARRQIFIAFAVLLLVQKFDDSVQAVTALFVVNNGVNFFLSPTIGRAIIRFGERRVLTLGNASLVAVFLADAVTDSKWVAAGLYILDHIFFNFSMAIN